MMGWEWYMARNGRGIGMLAVLLGFLWGAVSLGMLAHLSRSIGPTPSDLFELAFGVIDTTLGLMSMGIGVFAVNSGFRLIARKSAKNIIRTSGCLAFFVALFASGALQAVLPLPTRLAAGLHLALGTLAGLGFYIFLARKLLREEGFIVANALSLIGWKATAILSVEVFLISVSFGREWMPLVPGFTALPEAWRARVEFSVSVFLAGAFYFIIMRALEPFREEFSQAQPAGAFPEAEDEGGRAAAEGGAP
jgi:hypothetical protein